MKVKNRAFLALPLLAPLAVLPLVSPTTVEPGPTWGISTGDPTSSGNPTFEVEVEYSNDVGALKSKTITATLPEVTGGMSASAKGDAVREALGEAAGASENTVDGNPLITTGNVNNLVAVSPAGDVGGSFSGVKIKHIEPDDDGTNEADEVQPPSGSSAIATVRADGDITGVDESESPSVLTVNTNVGSFTVALSGSMLKRELLEAVADGLDQQGATVWLDRRRGRVLTLLDGDPLGAIGAGSSDTGLAVRTGVRAAH